jgi:glycosyltransferase involved in cell wall biosynthesis
MKAKEIWVVVPFSRPEYLTNVIKNFTQQKFNNKKLVIVENGKAIGSCKRFGFSPDILLSSEAHQSYAKNKALEVLKAMKAEYWVTFDDDDWYGPEYLSEIVEHSDKAEVIGKPNVFVKTVDDSIRLFSGYDEMCYSNHLIGPTISAWVSDSVLFKNNGKWSEDTLFVGEMVNKGARVWNTSKWHFLQQRNRNQSHTWMITDEQMIQTWYHSSLHKDLTVHEISGTIPELKEIISNKLNIPYLKIIEKKEWDKEYDPSYSYSKLQFKETFDNWVESQIIREE